MKNSPTLCTLSITEVPSRCAHCLLNILNPKLTIFFLAFLPQFVATDGQSSLGQLVGLSAIFMAES